ncbi:MAG: hypothetical protein V7727_14010 [Sneathiella sp.]
MKNIICLMALGVLAACTTTDTNYTPTAKETTNPYYIGYYVGYSEVCAFFAGDGADKLTMKALRGRYAGHQGFAKGVKITDSLYVGDRVTGLNDCGKARVIVNAAALQNT